MQNLQLENPSGNKIETAIHKIMAINLLEGMAKRSPTGPDRINDYSVNLRYIALVRDLRALLSYSKKALFLPREKKGNWFKARDGRI